MAKKITISFKENKRDLELFEILDNLDDKSYEIKKALRELFMNIDKKDENK